MTIRYAYGSKYTSRLKRKVPVSSSDLSSSPNSGVQQKIIKKDNVEAAELRELEDKGGLESMYQVSMSGVAHIPLDNIHVSPMMEVNVNKDRVRFIANSIRKRYNPALSVLVVCPADNTKKMDVKQDKFFVV